MKTTIGVGLSIIEFLVFLMATHAACIATENATHDSSIFRRLIVQRLAAVQKGNSRGYLSLVSADFIHIDDAGVRRTAAQMPDFLKAVSGAHPYYDVGTVHARRFGSIAVADGDVLEHVPAGVGELRFPLHETDVFVQQRGRWLFLNHQETHIVRMPKVTSGASGLDDYVGKYQWCPGFIDTITRKGDRLFAQETGDRSATPLLAASEEAYFVEGDPSLIVFVRNSSGRVTHYLLHWPDGQITVAKKLH